ncbi:MAG: hypothetical protein ABI729_01640 [Chitinophagales bacterium]
MNKEQLVNSTVRDLTQLPDDKLQEAADFVSYLLWKVNEQLLQEGIHKLASESGSFDFLNHEEDLYTLNDLKEKYR